MLINVAYDQSTNPCRILSGDSGQFSAAQFFQDSPWLKIPSDRCGEILIEPLYPRLGLLGGASTGGAGKPSKLAQLAAARRKKQSENLQPGTDQSENAEKMKNLSLLDKLNYKQPQSRESQDGSAPEPLQERTPRGYPKRRKTSHGSQVKPDPQQPADAQPAPIGTDPPTQETKQQPAQNQFRPANAIESDIGAPPSAFARTLFGIADSDIPEIAPTNPQDSAAQSIPLSSLFDFSTPSPDAVILNAQKNSKGSKATGGGKQC